ncbi:sensor histidine kinase [Pricia sp. S334]|uniref:histidine kinase n=1 Tax=Pricia mediterranea TaxID=3076079 RepID=A0ABU3L7W1_9FLAO|nr:sensor histidine kinase [Pricia sp. S334]MDT7829834.1 sensor histidine kinase [Pricia sp. S334]
MAKSIKIPYKTDDQTRLMYRFVYVSSALTAIFGLFCLYPLGILGVVPMVCFSYCLLNLSNITLLKKHGNLKATALLSGVISLLAAISVILFSGGINSPFIFILGVIVLGGYAGARIFGTVYLNAAMLAVLLIFIVGEAQIPFIVNEVPAESRPHFSLISLLFAVYLVGGVFGKSLVRSHDALVKSKAELERRIAEKEVLLREVHHRVKNNLQTVSSLLNLQAKNSTNEKIGELINSSQNRVASMAMIHEMLYVRHDLSKIEFRPYVQELTNYLITSTDNKDKNIGINLNMVEVHLCIDTAIPLGLLINEAVTNSLKYGFLDNANGQIDISLKIGDAENAYVLSIKDDGIGFSPELNKNKKSLGLKLIHNLARQLRGSVQLKTSDQGTHYQVVFLDVDRHRTIGD